MSNPHSALGIPSPEDDELSRTFSGEKLAQKPDELRAFCELLREWNVRSYLEVGARYGDTFHEVGKHLEPGATMVALDMPNGPWGRNNSEEQLRSAVDDLRTKHNASVVFGDSRVPATIDLVYGRNEHKPFDVVFIDGDHSIEGVVLDWVNYGPMGKIIAFHDIAPVTQKTIRKVHVPYLWRILKARYKYKEIHSTSPGMGIGIIWRDS